MMHYRLRTLMIALGLMPPLLAGIWFLSQSDWENSIPGGFLGWYLMMCLIVLGPWVILALLIIALVWKICSANGMRHRTIMILMGAVPIWAYLIAGVSQGFGLGAAGFLIAPIGLVGIAAALYRLTRRLTEGFAIAVLMSPIVLLIPFLLS
jgi:hypothetical protein